MDASKGFDRVYYKHYLMFSLKTSIEDLSSHENNNKNTTNKFMSRKQSTEKTIEIYRKQDGDKDHFVLHIHITYNIEKTMCIKFGESDKYIETCF